MADTTDRCTPSPMSACMTHLTTSTLDTLDRDTPSPIPGYFTPYTATPQVDSIID